MIKYFLTFAVAIGATGTGIWYSGILSSNSKDISSLINEDKTIILVKENSEWNEKWELYKKDNKGKKANEDLWNLEGWTNPASQTVLESFKNKCSSILKEKVKNQEDKKYLEAVKYCARDRKISDLFSESKLTLLSKTGQDDSWKTRWEKFQQTNGAILKGFSIEVQETKENSFSKLATACETAFNKPVKETEYLDNFEPIKKWCSAESTFQ